MLNVSKPTLEQDGRYRVDVSFRVQGHPVLVSLKANRELSHRISDLVSKKNSFGAVNAYPDLWQRMDATASAVGSITSNPYVLMALRSMPYSADATWNINQAVQAYIEIQRGRRDVFFNILAAARLGDLRAIDAIKKIGVVAQADILRMGAAQKNPAALARFGEIASGIAAGDPHALEAYTVLDGLHRQQTGQTPIQPPVIRVNHDWSGEESPDELAFKFGQVIVQSAQQKSPASLGRLMTHLSFVNSKPYRGVVHRPARGGVPRLAA